MVVGFVVGIGTGLASATTSLCVLVDVIARGRTVEEAEARDVEVVVEFEVEVVVVLDARVDTVCNDGATATKELGETGFVELEAEVALPMLVEPVRTATVDGELVTTTFFGVSSEPTLVANRPASNIADNAAASTNFRRRVRIFGNPSARHANERTADVPDNERLNEASRTRSRNAAEGPASCALATMVDGFTSILRRRSHESQSCA